MHVRCYGSGTTTVFFRLPVANLFYPTQWLSISLFCAISSPIPFIHLCSSSPVLSVSTSQLVWATCSLLLLSHVHIVPILLSVERQFSRNIFSNYVICEFLPITLSLFDFEIPVRPDCLPYCVFNSVASLVSAVMKINITDMYVSEAAFASLFAWFDYTFYTPRK